MELTKSNKCNVSVRDTFSDFERIEFLIDELVNEIVKQSRENPKAHDGKPITIGFNIKINPSGKTHIESNNNLAVTTEKQVSLNSQELLSEISESEDSVFVTLQLSGVQAHELSMYFANETTLVVECAPPEGPYQKTIQLAQAVDEKSLVKKFNNHVLEVFLKKKK